MAKEIIDIYIEQGYEYGFVLDYNAVDGSSLENNYTCYFECDSLGAKTFSVVNNTYDLTLSEADTNNLGVNLEEYVVYTEDESGKKDKLLSGRMHIDFKVRS